MKSLSRTWTGRPVAAARIALQRLAVPVACLLLAAGAHAQTGTAVVKHAPELGGRVDGSVQMLRGENVFVHGRNTVLTGDLLVPGTPGVAVSRRAQYSGTVDGTGAEAPSSYRVVLGDGVRFGRVVRRTDPVALPAVPAPGVPTGTRKVTLRRAGQSPGDFATLRNLTLQRDAGAVAVPAGTYGDFSAHDDASFVLGVAGATEPSVYNFQSLRLNGGSRLCVVGPVVVNLAGGLVLNRDHDRRGWRHDRRERFSHGRGDDYDVAVGSPRHPEWLVLNLASGGLGLNRGDSFHGYVNAPAGTVHLDDRCTLVGGARADRLKIHDRSRLALVGTPSNPPPPANQSPSVSLEILEGNSVGALTSVTLQATATDSDGSIAQVEFFDGGRSLGTAIAAPYRFTWASLAVGSYTLTARATDNLGASAVSAPVTLTVNKLPATVALGGLSGVYDGAAKPVSISTQPAGLNILVSYDGLSDAPSGAGTYQVVATVDDPVYAGSASGTLTITKAAPSVTWATPADIVFGTALSAAQLNATANVPGAFAYSPAAGTALPVGSGLPLSVVFTPADTANYTTATASTSINVGKAPAGVVLSNLTATYDGAAKSVSVTTAPAGLDVVVTYDGSELPPTAAGTYAVVATVNDGSYAGSATATLTVGKATPVLAWPAPVGIVYGTVLSEAQLNATASIPGSFAYSPAAGTLLPAGAAQPLAAVFTPADSANYDSASIATVVDVARSAAVVTLGDLLHVYDGTAKPATVTTIPTGLNVSLAYDGSAAAPVAAGSYAVTATVDEPNYTGNADATLLIAKATPVVTWPAPGSIPAGTALSSAQLNATASVPGSFVYSPSAGTVLGSGAGQPLSVLFTPTDAANYATVSASTAIDVVPAQPAVIAIDSTSSATVTAATTTLVWTHTLNAASGNHRALLVGVVSRGSGPTRYDIASVTFNGTAMHLVDGATAVAGSSTFNQSKQFYLLDSELPAPGTYDVVVTFVASQTASNNPVAGAVSLVNVEQTAPEGLANSSGTGTAGSVSTEVSGLPGSWVFDTVGVGSSSANLRTNATGMTEWFRVAQSGGLPNSGAAGAVQVVGPSGTATLSWLNATARVVQSLAVFRPVVTTPAAPVVVTQPLSQDVTLGADMTLRVAATGSAPLSYQWYRNGVAIPGATSAVHRIPAATASAAGTYMVYVSNPHGHAWSDSAVLSLVGEPPTITKQPLPLNLVYGEDGLLLVEAVGTEPLSYQWYKDSQPVVSGAVSALPIYLAQDFDTGSYYCVVSSPLGSVTSDTVQVTVGGPPIPPYITTQPVPVSAPVGASVTFSVVAAGGAPLSYQWQKDETDIPGATASTLTLANLATANAGNYRVVVTNSLGSVTSFAVPLTVIPPTEPSAIYNLAGFATQGAGCTGGGIVAESDPAYRKVTTPLEFAQAIKDSRTVGAVRVIEIMNDLDLGWNEVGTEVQTMASTPFREHTAPKLHPVLIATGVSLIDIKSRPGLTIFSANGATIRHATFNLKETSNLVIRNLKFDELWEWDEATRGDYDSNDWDFMVLSNGSPATNIWIDHCTFTKAYDGIVDMKKGTQNVTVSWCKVVGDDSAANPNGFVARQVQNLEWNYGIDPFYYFLRNVGFAPEDIVRIHQGQTKGFLMGANSLDDENATLTATFHHVWLQNVWDRAAPRLRGGQVHNYNLCVDVSGALAAKRFRNEIAATLDTATRNTLDNTYSFNPPLNGVISTEGAAILVEKSVYIDCLYPLRNNQTDVTNPLYTGKILATDTIYSLLNADGTTTYVRGDSTDAGNPLGPFQAPLVPFSWNTFATLPYSYTLDDPAALQPILQAGAGAGVIFWPKENWLKVSY